MGGCTFPEVTVFTVGWGDIVPGSSTPTWKGIAVLRTAHFTGVLKPWESCPVGDGQEPGSGGNWDEEGGAETPEEETGAAPKRLLLFLSLTLGLTSHDPPRAVISSAVIGPSNYGIIIF